MNRIGDIIDCVSIYYSVSLFLYKYQTWEHIYYGMILQDEQDLKKKMMCILLMISIDTLHLTMYSANLLNRKGVSLFLY